MSSFLSLLDLDAMLLFKNNYPLAWTLSALVPLPSSIVTWQLQSLVISGPLPSFICIHTGKGDW